MNAANEVAVEAFLARRIGFLDIVSTVEQTLEQMHATGALAPAGGSDVLETAMTVDRQARAVAAGVLRRDARVH